MMQKAGIKVLKTVLDGAGLIDTAQPGADRGKRRGTWANSSLKEQYQEHVSWVWRKNS